MRISIIAAMANHRVIGANGVMPWHLPADLRHFKEITLGKPIVMGRKTFASIGRPLPGRRNIIVTRNQQYSEADCETAGSLQQALDMVGSVAEVMIIGGGVIYTQALPLANYMYLTFIDITVQGDTYFPQWQQSDWQEVSREAHPMDHSNQFAYTFAEYQRINR